MPEVRDEQGNGDEDDQVDGLQQEVDLAGSSQVTSNLWISEIDSVNLCFYWHKYRPTDDYLHYTYGGDEADTKPG
jgi:hypothetical protein